MLNIPVTFSRIDEYYGFWLVHQPAAEAMFRYAQSIDLAAHISAALARPQPATSPLVDMLPGKGQQQTAVVKLTGTLMKQQSSLGGNNTSTIAARRAIRSAAADPNVSGILLAIDSPGGTVAGTADLAADVKAASRRKPIIAHIDDLGASAAYWIASQADAVYANTPTALVGSVGTILSITDSSGAADKTGIRQMVFSTGPLKSAGYDGQPVGEEQAAYFQGLVDSLQQEFDAAVQRGRRLSDTKLAAVKSGAVYPAAEAQRLGLIDGVQPLEKSLAMLASAK